MFIYSHAPMTIWRPYGIADALMQQRFYSVTSLPQFTQNLQVQNLILFTPMSLYLIKYIFHILTETSKKCSRTSLYARLYSSYHVGPSPERRLTPTEPLARRKYGNTDTRVFLVTYWIALSQRNDCETGGRNMILRRIQKSQSVPRVSGQSE